MYYIVIDRLSRRTVTSSVGRFLLMVFLIPFWFFVMIAVSMIFRMYDGLNFEMIGMQISLAIWLVGLIIIVLALYKRFADDGNLERRERHKHLFDKSSDADTKG